jgi:hypothetical protein
MDRERKESTWLCKNIGDDFTVDVGQAKVSTCMPRSFLRLRGLLSSKTFSIVC